MILMLDSDHDIITKWRPPSARKFAVKFDSLAVNYFHGDSRRLQTYCNDFGVLRMTCEYKSLSGFLYFFSELPGYGSGCVCRMLKLFCQSLWCKITNPRHNHGISRTLSRLQKFGMGMSFNHVVSHFGRVLHNAGLT